MKNLNKILIAIISLSCIFGTASAQNAIKNSDCGIFGALSYSQNGSENGFTIVNQRRETDNYDYTKFLTPEEQKAIITKADLNTAILNLKKYCCENQLGGLKQNFDTCKKDKSLFNNNTPDSPYLFDHLFDVIMRRLSGLSGENYIYTKTNMTLDDKGVARREWIIKQATSPDGAISQTIIDEFKKFRTISPANLGYNILKIYKKFLGAGEKNNQEILNYVNGNGLDESKSIANALKHYKDWSLYDRYINACVLSEYFYVLLETSGKSTDKKDISIISSCEEIVNKQLRSEKEYTSFVIKNSANQFLSNYINGYMDYLDERQLNFENVRTNSVDKRLDVIRAVPCLQRKCVK